MANGEHPGLSRPATGIFGQTQVATEFSDQVRNDYLIRQNAERGEDIGNHALFESRHQKKNFAPMVRAKVAQQRLAALRLIANRPAIHLEISQSFWRGRFSLSRFVSSARSGLSRLGALILAD